MQRKIHDKLRRWATAAHGNLAGFLSPRLFKALGDSNRVALLVRLAESHGARTVSQAAEGSSLDLSVVSRHLAVLREAGIIKCSKHGKEVWCSVETGKLVQVLRGLADALEKCCPAESQGRKVSVRAPAHGTTARSSIR